MKPSHVEYLSDRAELFESALTFAWVYGGEGEIITVQECSPTSPLRAGETYSLKKLILPNDLAKLNVHTASLTEKVSVLHFHADIEGAKYSVECSSKLVAGECVSLWIFHPEVQNPIFYLQNAAHDFRSPLGSIIGVVNLLQHTLLKDEKIDRDEFAMLLDMVKVNTDKAMNLASEVLELAEMESGTYKLETVKTDISSFVQNFLNTHRLLLLKKRISVKYTAQTEAWVQVNQSKLTRAIDNVLSNAVKFSEVGSSIEFTLTEKKDFVNLEITDHGIGMSDAILKEVFVRFGKSKRSGLQGEPSHGLGMSIVRQILRLHGGDVKVASKEGKGTTVCLMIKKI